MEQKRELAIKMLVEKQAALGGRMPKRGDFTNEEACFIKQKLGPWPRALEVAGLKERKGPTSAEKNRARRARIKRNLKLARENDRAMEDIESTENEESTENK